MNVKMKINQSITPVFLFALKAKPAKKNEQKRKRPSGKAANATKRQKAGEKQAYQAARKAAKRIANSLALKQAKSLGLQAELVGDVRKAAEEAYLRHLKVPVDRS